MHCSNLSIDGFFFKRMALKMAIRLTTWNISEIDTEKRNYNTRQKKRFKSTKFKAKTRPENISIRSDYDKKLPILVFGFFLLLVLGASNFPYCFQIFLQLSTVSECGNGSFVQFYVVLFSCTSVDTVEWNHKSLRLRINLVFMCHADGRGR